MTELATHSGDADSGNPLRRRMLVVEDDAALRQVIRRTFAAEYEVHESADGAAGLDAALAVQPDVVITDQRMPRLTGVELLSHLREKLPRSVRILVTGYDDYGSVVDAVNAASIHHYFEKPFHPHQMRTVVDALVRAHEAELQRDDLLLQLQESVAQLEQANLLLQGQEKALRQQVEARTAEIQHRNDELVEANMKLKDLAVRDGLTGLFNHRYLIEHLAMEVARSQRYGRQFCLLFVDVDDFKQVNDQHGHMVGDSVLCQIAELFMPRSPEGLRQSDFCARYGGEEFCILLPETDPKGGEIKANRLLEAIRGFEWSSLDPELTGPVTVSIGMACFPQHGKETNDLLKCADDALYTAKRLGKDGLAVHTGRKPSSSTPSAP